MTDLNQEAFPSIPQVDIPQVGIPHMGIGSTHNTPQEASVPPAHIDQALIDAAIAHVQETGNTEGLAPDVLQAACAQIEAQAVAQGLDLSTVVPAKAPENAQAAAPQPGPSSSVEAAVIDKKGAFEAFDKQRDSLKEAVIGQRDALKQTYVDAVQKTDGHAPNVDAETMKELAAALSDLDPKTMALVNAMSMLTRHPDMLNSIVYLEVIRIIRQFISSEVKQQVEASLKSKKTEPWPLK